MLFRISKTNSMIFYIRIIIFLLFFQTILAQSVTNSVDEKGKKHGVWNGFYEESGRPRYEGTFEHGKEIGMFQFFDDTKAKSVIATRTFDPKDNSCYTIFYDQKKNVVSEGKEVNKLREGIWKYYHKASKQIMTLENYKKGKLDGVRTVYYPTGKVVEETIYKNGLKDGDYKKYSEKGIVLESTFFKNGEFDGEAVYKDPNDQIVAKGKYKNGIRIGIWQYFIDGKLVSEENMATPKKPKLRQDKVKID